MARPLALTGSDEEALFASSHPPSPRITYHWNVEFSRFFNFPRILSSSINLKPLPQCKTRSKGTWLSSSSSSPSLTVSLIPKPEPMLFVSMQGKTLEEHFVSNLHFSWPQVSCTTDCPTRGSRVVLASFRDCLGQIQKFALRFYTGNDSQRFMDAVKISCKMRWNRFNTPLLYYKPIYRQPPKSLTDIISIKFPGGDFGCQNTSRSEYIASNALQNRTDEESNFVNPDVDCSPEMPVLSLLCNQHLHPQQLSTADSFEAVHSALPPSFTDLLTGIDTEKDPPKAPEETDLRSQITRYLLDSSFHEMLVKVDKVIGELGGDLSL
eukprot:TRINITY_DN15397_c1_g1_i5.p1 TRINITY_DN15397_c1_g1~~TRINITY_DN15397_c1_g1_i5.p1  ORF type:complete len:323 (-),score=53.50 TRINITY_DN15397_c1_g1_i5:498-1466(-)